MILSYKYLDAEGLDRTQLARKQSETAIELLDMMLSKLCIHDYKVERDEKGRPFLSTHPNVDFNISHAGNIAVCAVSVGEGRVGVDAEKSDLPMSEVRKEKFAKRFLSDGELKSETTLTFAWTRKEAYLKYLGTGLAVDLRSVDPCNDESVRFESFVIGDYTVTVCMGRRASISVSS